LASVGSLAEVLRSQGKYDAAETLNRRALEGREKALGKEHRDILAEVLLSQGKHGAAEEMHRRALEGREKILETGHPEEILLQLQHT
jgi:hypothetical protein